MNIPVLLEEPSYRQSLGRSCPVSGTELFLVGSPKHRQRFNTETEMLRLHLDESLAAAQRRVAMEVQN